MKKVCWALIDKQARYHRDLDFEHYEPILPQLFRTKKQAQALIVTNQYYRRYVPAKVLVRISPYLC